MKTRSKSQAESDEQIAHILVQLNKSVHSSSPIESLKTEIERLKHELALKDAMLIKCQKELEFAKSQIETNNVCQNQNYGLKIIESDTSRFFLSTCTRASSAVDTHENMQGLKP